MASSDLLSAPERLLLDEAIRRAEQTSRFEFSVYLGPIEGTEARPFATQLHNRLVAPAHSVLIMVDPTARVIEVVTGGEVRRNLSDAEVELAVTAMAEDLSAGNYATGLVRAIDLIAEHARRD